MTFRVRAVSLGGAAALVAGLVMAPVGGASAAGPDESMFSPISADAASSAQAGATAERQAAASRRSAQQIRAKVAMTGKPQILQTWKGIQGVGSQGVSVAAGPKQVVEAAGTGIRAYAQNTGATPKGGNKTLKQFFGLAAFTSVTQPVVAYDPVGKRFVAVAVTDDAGDIGLAMRISKGTTATPLTGKKWLKTVLFASDASDQEEPARRDANESHPKIGISADKIVVTTVADDPNDPTVANRIFVLPKQAYYRANEIGAWAASVDSTYDGQQPAVNSTKQVNAYVTVPSDLVMPSGAGDISVTAYTGKATSKPPIFSKNVLYPAKPLVAPPPVAQTGGDPLDLGALEFTGAAWRANTLYTATTVTCDTDPGPTVVNKACVQVFGVSTASGVTLKSNKILKSSAGDLFSPDLAMDKGKNVIVTANEVGTQDGPSLAVFARKAKGGKWTGARFVRNGSGVANPPGSPIAWSNSTGAATDPSSPWDVWVGGAVADGGVVDGLSSSIARVSLAKNKATIKASATSVGKGSKVKFTVKLQRPESKDTIKGLPVALQKSPASKNTWSTVRSGKTSPAGKASWTLKVKKAAKYRTLGKVVKQKNGAGRAVVKVTSKPLTVTLT